MKIDNYLSERKSPTLAAKLAWCWYTPYRHDEILKQYGSERDLVLDTVSTLKSSLSEAGKTLRLKDEYVSMRKFFQDAIDNVLLFASTNNLNMLQAEDTIYDGIILMADNNIRRIPIVNKENTLIGIFTVHDIIRLLGRIEKYESFYQDENNNLDMILAGSVDHIAIHNPITLSENHSVFDAVKTMVDNEIGGIPIVDGDKLIGIITERDILYLTPLLRELSGKNIPFVPQKDVITVIPDTTIFDAIKIMAKEDIRRLPVVDKGRLTGIITTTDIIQANYSLTNLFSEVLSFPVKDIMIQNTYFITPKDSIDDAINLMCHWNIGSLLIMEGEELMGIITERDVLKYAYELLKP